MSQQSSTPKMLVETFEEKEARLVDLVAKSAAEVEQAPAQVALFREGLKESEAKLKDCGATIEYIHLSAVLRDREYLEQFVAAEKKWTQLHASVVEQLAAHRASRA